MQRQKGKAERVPRYEVERLKDPQASIKYREALSKKLEVIRRSEIASGKVEWGEISGCIKAAAEETIGVQARDGRKRAFIDDTLAAWSDAQRKLRLDILSCPNAIKRQEMKTKRHQLLKLIKRRVKQLHTDAIEAKVAAVDKCKDSARMFQAIRE